MTKIEQRELANGTPLEPVTARAPWTAEMPRHDLERMFTGATDRRTRAELLAEMGWRDDHGITS